jgi:hypothetical protein
LVKIGIFTKKKTENTAKYIEKVVKVRKITKNISTNTINLKVWKVTELTITCKFKPEKMSLPTSMIHGRLRRDQLLSN